MHKTIGFFGGTFDPIHLGHLNLAIQLSEFHHLQEVLFCPAYCSPFKKENQPHVSGKHRLQMCKLALENIPHFRVISYEIERADPSYTIDTLRALKQEMGKEIRFRLLLSEEAASKFDQWKEFQELIRIAPPLIGTRSPVQLHGKLAKILRSSFTPTQIFEISSTEVRTRLKKGLYCGHLLPAKVLEYIQKNQLYGYP